MRGVICAAPPCAAVTRAAVSAGSRAGERSPVLISCACAAPSDKCATATASASPIEQPTPPVHSQLPRLQTVAGDAPPRGRSPAPRAEVRPPPRGHDSTAGIRVCPVAASVSQGATVTPSSPSAHQPQKTPNAETRRGADEVPVAHHSMRRIHIRSLSPAQESGPRVGQYWPTV
jgi:hypothetical protein